MQIAVEPLTQLPQKDVAALAGRGGSYAGRFIKRLQKDLSSLAEQDEPTSQPLYAFRIDRQLIGLCRLKASTNAEDTTLALRQIYIEDTYRSKGFDEQLALSLIENAQTIRPLIAKLAT